jgi:hypothetical protein
MNCKESIMHGFHLRQCSRNAVKDGYCTQHHPDSVKARRDKQDAEWKRKQENSIYARFGRLQAKLKAVKAECQDYRDSYAPNQPHDTDLLESIEQIVGRDMT